MNLILPISVLISSAVVYSATIPPTPYWVSCEYKQNGILEVACWGYITCKAGVPYTTYCPDGQVYDVDTGSCVISNDKHLNCTKVSKCDSMYDHRYPDMSAKCETYYFCMAGSFFGRYSCPKGLVFNEPLQACDYPGDTPPPCGTLNYTRTTYVPNSRL